MNVRVTHGDWHHRAVCKCGYHTRAESSVGAVSIVAGYVMRLYCCPKCGELFDSTKIMRCVIRVERGRWWQWTKESREWETKAEKGVRT